MKAWKGKSGRGDFDVDGLGARSTWRRLPPVADLVYWQCPWRTLVRNAVVSQGPALCLVYLAVINITRYGVLCLWVYIPVLCIVRAAFGEMYLIAG
jgi:hypothetical protein